MRPIIAMIVMRFSAGGATCDAYDKPAATARSITSDQGTHWLGRPTREPMGTMAGFESEGAPEPMGGMAGFGEISSQDPVGGMAGFESGSGGRKYRPTVSRCTPSSRAILRADHPLAASVAIECCRLTVS